MPLSFALKAYTRLLCKDLKTRDGWRVRVDLSSDANARFGAIVTHIRREVSFGSAGATCVSSSLSHDMCTLCLQKTTASSSSCAPLCLWMAPRNVRPRTRHHTHHRRCSSVSSAELDSADTNIICNQPQNPALHSAFAGEFARIGGWNSA